MTVGREVHMSATISVESDPQAHLQGYLGNICLLGDSAQELLDLYGIYVNNAVDAGL